MNVPVKDGVYAVTLVKRIAPGTVKPACANASLLHYSHDATTFNKNSGSPVINMNGEVVGIHVSGTGAAGEDADNCNLALKSTAAPALRGTAVAPVADQTR
jgi:S1-C subfamily serine protease